MPNAINTPALLREPGVGTATINRWMYSLSDPAAPQPIHGAGRDDARAHAEKIRAFLDVENKEHRRYLKQPINGKNQTFCNVYAHDAAMASGAYLPLVWWSWKARLKLAQGKDVVAKPGVTVGALKANALHGWFVESSAPFGWTRVPRIVDAQRLANDGHFVVIMARGGMVSTGALKAGHIAWIVAETGPEVSADADEATFIPTISQAGSNNLRQSTARGRWWTKGYDAVGFWSHPGSRAP